MVRVGDRGTTWARGSIHVQSCGHARITRSLGIAAEHRIKHVGPTMRPYVMMRLSRHATLHLAAAALAGGAHRVAAQAASATHRQITLNFGVDTTAAVADGWRDYSWHGPVPQIIRNWIAYLRADSAGRIQPGTPPRPERR